MQYRSKCEAKLRVVVTGNSVTVQRNFEHTEEHHVYETATRLSVSVIRSIEVAVHSDVRQSVTAIRRNVSTEEAPIEVQQNDRVRRVVKRARQEEMVQRSPVERGFVPNGDLGTLRKFAQDHSMLRFLKRHNNVDDSFHLGSYDMFVAASNFDEDTTDFAIFYSCVFMLTTLFRVIESGWAVNMCVDLFHRFCTADVKMIGFGAMVLGGKNYPILLGTIPDTHGKSNKMYQNAWQVLCNMLRRFVREGKPYGYPNCSSCTETNSAMSGKRVHSLISSQQFIQTGGIPL